MRTEMLQGPSFGIMYKTKSAKKYIDKLPLSQCLAIELMRIRMKKNPLPMTLQTYIDIFGKERLSVDLGTEKFTEGLFRNPAQTVHKGVRYLEKVLKVKNSQKFTLEMNA